MKRTYLFVKASQEVICSYGLNKTVTIPVIPGILKHPRPEQLPELLTRPGVLAKYAGEALRKASWPVLKQFPRFLLRDYLDRVHLRPSRRKAIAFLLSRD